MVDLSNPRRIVGEAFGKFETQLSLNDACLFKKTTLADVQEIALNVQHSQARRGCLRNMRRLDAFLKALSAFAVVLEPLCPDHACLNFIWAPIGLSLQVTEAFAPAFEKFIDAYHQIAEHLPLFDRLTPMLLEDEGVQSVIAHVCSDILEFHSYTYRLLRRNCWQLLFNASWQNFSLRFSGTIERLGMSRKALDIREESITVSEYETFGLGVLDRISRRETERDNSQLRNISIWLNLTHQDDDQEAILENRSRTRRNGTCEWILQHPRMRSWLDLEDERPLLWLYGKPGSGKTTIAVFLIENAPRPANSTVLYFLCPDEFPRPGLDAYAQISQYLIAQLITKNQSLLPYLHDKLTSSRPKVKALLPELLKIAGPTFLIIDGLDQCEIQSQKRILVELADLSSLKESGSSNRALVKVLICSRSTMETASYLRRVPRISLFEETISITKDISAFVKNNLSPLYGLVHPDSVEEIEHMVVAKADGMFLWVKLVLDQLLSQHTVQELYATLAKLPLELSQIYSIILHRLQDCDDQQRGDINRVLGLVLLSYRPLKVWEVCGAILCQNGQLPLNGDTKILHGVIDMCKPLVEERKHQTIGLIHQSVKEYLLTASSGPYKQLQLAHINITQACIRCLTTCQPFTRDKISPETQKQIVQGYYDFLPYAYRYWRLHLRESFRNPTPTVSTDFAHGRKTICHLLFDLLKVTNQSRMDTESLDKIEAQKESFNSQAPNLGQLPEPIQRLIAIENPFSRHGENPSSYPDTTASTSGNLQGSSILNVAFTNFQNAFEELFEAGPSFDLSRLGITFTELDSFRTRHSHAPYLCRCSECDSGAVGFIGALERDEHELRHRELFQCPEVECDFQPKSFVSRTALWRHMKNHHSHEDTPPQSSRTKVKLPTYGRSLPRSATSGKAASRRAGNPTNEFKDETEANPLARLFQSCVELFKLILSNIHESQAPANQLKAQLMRALNTLQLWGDAYHVEEGYLDKLLCKSTEVRTTTATLLSDIGSILSSRSLRPVFETETKRLAAIDRSRIQIALDEARYITEDHDWLHDDDESGDESAYTSGISNNSRADEVKAIADSLCDRSLELMQMADLFDSPFLHEKVSKEMPIPPLAESTGFSEAKSPVQYQSGAPVEIELKLPTTHQVNPTPDAGSRSIQSPGHVNVSHVQEGPSVLHNPEGSQKVSSFSSYCYGMIFGKVLVQSSSPLSVSDLIFVPPDRLFQTPKDDQWASLEEQVADVCSSLTENHEVSLQISVRNDEGKSSSSDESSARKANAEHPRCVLANIIIYGPLTLCESIGDYLSDAGFYLQDPTHCNQDVPYLNPHILGSDKDTLLFTSELFPDEPEDEEVSTKLSKTPFSNFYSESEVEETAQPNGIVTPLLAHQKQALTFMIQREKGWDLSATRNDFWTTHFDAFGTTRYKNTVSGVTQATRPEFLQGGIIADEMGLGKTLSMVSLIVANPSPIDDLDPWASLQHGKRFAKSTLIVVPSLSLISLWQGEILMHCQHVRCQVFHGPGRHKAVNIGESDIVLTTYNTVAMDWNRSSNLSSGPSVLFETCWHRVVLDEAHYIRNRTTQNAKAVHALTSQRRWCITGTPIQNRLTDLFGLFYFLRLDPFGDWKVFEEEILRPWKSRLDDIALARLQSITKAIMLRRSLMISQLPTPTEHLIKVTFNAEEREQYDRLVTRGKKDLDNALSAHQQPSSFVYLSSLQIVNDLRYICNHGFGPTHQGAEGMTSDMFEIALSTIPGDEAEPEEATLARDCLSTNNVEESPSLRFIDSDDSADESVPSLTSSGTSTRASSLDPTEDAPAPWATSLDLVCALCGAQKLDPTEESYDFGSEAGTYAGHIPSQLCKNCLEHERFPLSDLATHTESAISNEPERQTRRPMMQRSSKIEALVTWITNVPTNEKSVVFSAWTRSLCAVEDALSEAGVSCVHFDGAMTPIQRHQVLEMFVHSPSIRVILMPIAGAAAGVNLTIANHIFLLEPQWNPTVEAQAIARVVRLGQTQRVSLYRFVVEDTCEENMMVVRARKTTLANLVVDRSTVHDGKVGKKQLYQLRGLVA